MGEAVLSVYDRKSDIVYDLPISWDKNHLADAKIEIPKKFKDVWNFVANDLRKRITEGEIITPYKNMPFTVERDKITKSTLGFFTIASEIWFDEIGWKVPHPRLKTDEEREDVDL